MSNRDQTSKEFQGYSLTALIKTVPKLPRAIAIVIMLCNICFPSSGTFYMACIGGKLRKTQFMVAGLQLLLTPLLIGYFWSLYWGVVVVQKSYSYSEAEKLKQIANERLRNNNN